MLQWIRQILLPAFECACQGSFLDARVEDSGMHQHGAKKPVAHHMERPSSEQRIIGTKIHQRQHIHHALPHQRTSFVQGHHGTAPFSVPVLGKIIDVGILHLAHTAHIRSNNDITVRGHIEFLHVAQIPCFPPLVQMQFDGRLGRSTVGNTHYHSHRHLTLAIQLETIFLEVAAMGSARRHHALCQSRAWQCGWQRLLSKHTFVQTQEAAHLLLDFFNRLGTEGFALFSQFVISTHGVLHRALGISELQVDLTRTGAKHIFAPETHLVNVRQCRVAL